LVDTKCYDFLSVSEKRVLFASIPLIITVIKLDGNMNIF